jgi:hypothetical protein
MYDHMMAASTHHTTCFQVLQVKPNIFLEGPNDVFKAKDSKNNKLTYMDYLRRGEP